MFTKAEKHTVLAASCLAIFVNPLAGSMLNLALSAIQADFGCSEHQLGWVASIYFIVSVICLLPAAKIADIFGKKIVFLTGAVIAFAGVVLSMTATDIYTLYVYRGVTGVGMAAISATSVSMISDVYEPHERGLALAINTACVYVGASIGPTLGGVLTEFAGWRNIFLILVPFLVLAFIAMFRFKHNIKSTPDSHFDFIGTAVYAVGIGVLMFGIISLPAVHGIAMIIGGTAVLIGFIFIEAKETNPIMRLDLFKNTRFYRSMLALFLNYAASYGVTFFMSRYLQEIGALSPTEAGVILMAQSVVQVIFTLWAGKIVTSMDMRILPTIGMLVTCVGLIMLMFMTETLNIPLIVAALMVLGAGLGMFSSPNVTAIMSYVKKEQYNSTSGLIATVRQFGMMMSMGIATCLIAVFLGTETKLDPSNFGIFMDILMYAWWIWLVFCIVGAIFSWFRGPSYTEG